MSKYRYDTEIENRREDVEIEFHHIMEALQFYMAEWHHTGSGTKGHAIGSLIKNIEEQYKFFDKYC